MFSRKHQHWFHRKFKGNSWVTLFYAAKTLWYLLICTCISTVPDVRWPGYIQMHQESHSHQTSDALPTVLNVRNDMKSECDYYLRIAQVSGVNEIRTKCICGFCWFYSASALLNNKLILRAEWWGRGETTITTKPEPVFEANNCIL